MAGGRKAKAPAPPPKPTNTFVLDNGASTLKAGFVLDGVIDVPEVIPNCIARDRTRKIYVASELDKCTDFGEIQFRRPVEKGFIVNWEVQSEIWDYEFFGSKAPFPCDPSETRLVLAEPPNVLPVLQSNCDQIVFEEYGFESYYRGVGTLLTIACATFYTTDHLQDRHSTHITTCNLCSEHRWRPRQPPTSLPRFFLSSTRDILTPQ